MSENTKKSNSKNCCLGQGMVEYILVFVAIVVVVITVVGPGGILSKKIDQSLNKAFVEGAKCMTSAICYDSDPAQCSTLCP